MILKRQLRVGVVMPEVEAEGLQVRGKTESREVKASLGYNKSSPQINKIKIKNSSFTVKTKVR